MNLKKSLSSQVSEICKKNNVIIPTKEMLIALAKQLHELEAEGVSVNDVVLPIGEAFGEKSLLGVCLKKDGFKAEDYLSKISLMVPPHLRGFVKFSTIDLSNYVSEEEQCPKTDPLQVIKMMIEGSNNEELKNIINEVLSLNEKIENDEEVENNDVKRYWDNYRIIKAASDYTGLNIGAQEYEIIHDLETCRLILGNVEFIIDNEYQIQHINPVIKETTDTSFTWNQTKIKDKACCYLNIGEDYVESIQRGSTFAVVIFNLNNVKLEVIVDINYEIVRVKLV